MRNLYLIIILLLLGSTLLFAQQPNQPQVIDLTKLGKTYKISARMELPQVKIFDKRIPPKFKEVNAEKSFANELSIHAEKIQFESRFAGQVKPITNIEELLNKKRF
ncbi:MAG: hypothetical protein Kow0037_05090 [Calditrichia bacterium]